MAARRHRQDIADLDRAVILSDLVSRTVKLTKRGNAHWGLCPFHKEKTPSFEVRDLLGTYHCFGCGSHGDTIAWLMRIEKLSFADATARLQSASGIDLASHYRSHKRASADAKARSMGHYQNALPLEGSVAGYWLRRAFGVQGPFNDVVRWRIDDWLFWEHTPAEPLKPPLVARVDDDAGFVTTYSRNADACLEAEPGLGAIRYGSPRPMMTLCASLIGAMWIAGRFNVPCWAALAEDRLGSVQIPDICTELIIFAESGDGWGMALKAADRHEISTRTVTVERLGDHINAIGSRKVS
jgi:hypothetical protein